MKRSDVERLTKHDLPEETDHDHAIGGTGFAPIRFIRYFDPANGQEFQLSTTVPFYRCTEIPSHADEVLTFGRWTKLDA